MKTTPQKESTLDRQLRELRAQLKSQSSEIDELKRNQDLQVTVYNGFHALEEVLKPLRGLNPVREPTKNEAKAIVMLRTSLRRPQFEMLDGHFPTLDPDKPNATETAA